MSPHHPWLPSSPPPQFVCPISLDLMKDPVILETGITYDRPSIQTWLSCGRSTCPVTGKTLLAAELIPNFTLYRLIHAWNQAQQQPQQQSFRRGGSSSSSAPQFISRLIKCVCIPETASWALSELKHVAKANPELRRTIASAGAFPVLVSVLSECTPKLRHGNTESLENAELSIAILSLLNCKEDSARALLVRTCPLECIAWILRWSSEEGRVNAVAVLEEIIIAQRRLRVVIGSSEGLIQGLVELLMERFSSQAVRSSLNALLALCSAKENKVKAVQAGAIPVIVEVLAQAEMATVCCEKALSVLEVLFLCPEGRETAVKHSHVISRIVEKISSVSPNASEYALGALWALCSLSHFLSPYYDAIQAGAVERISSLIQSQSCTPRTKSQGKQLLNSLQTASLLLQNKPREVSVIQAPWTTMASNHMKRRKERSSSS